MHVNAVPVFREPPAIGGEAGGKPSGLVLCALREQSALAVETFFARNVMKAHHAVAGREFCDARASGYDGAGEFVAENLRRIHNALENFFYIRARNAARPGLY